MRVCQSIMFPIICVFLLLIVAPVVKSDLEFVGKQEVTEKGTESPVDNSEAQPQPLEAVAPTPVEPDSAGNGSAIEPAPGKAVQNNSTSGTPIPGNQINGSGIVNGYDPGQFPARNSGYKSFLSAGRQDRLQISGSLNQKYVYLILQKIRNNDFAGYLYDGKGGCTYVYGTWLQGQIQVFDPKKGRLNVILHEK